MRVNTGLIRDADTLEATSRRDPDFQVGPITPSGNKSIQDVVALTQGTAAETSKPGDTLLRSHLTVLSLRLRWRRWKMGFYPWLFVEDKGESDSPSRSQGQARKQWLAFSGSGKVGPQMSVSIVLVNYRTPKQTKLCLRSLRQYTHSPCETIVVDNCSGDESEQYLRGLPWIRFFSNESPTPTHRNGLDLAIRKATGDLILTLHTDTFVRREGWLCNLLRHCSPDSFIVGTPDRVILPFRGASRLNLWWKRRKRTRRWRAKGASPKLISHCAVYRRELFTEHGQRFDHPEHVDGVYNDCGEFIQRYCENQRLGIRQLRCEELSPWLWHFEAATLNLVTQRRIPRKRLRTTERFYRRSDVHAILEDDSLDA